jgi:trehalose-6-phosphatase
VPFEANPQSAKPDAELKGRLNDLDKDSKNEVVIISGRRKI